ncbi:hypothetical protein PAXINDRAFT_101353 [Paxillus involutus ATCC 200175]|uniref:Uncharacterized protein n=1 Tax=Paxillus involutus ATCC 200175 TaxID=664439 RepID=A0A0C9TWV1_PAXIN|nr:hypothetical protein PAXINDRAFT_101353 [Paxillus involutus ATCC 200175]
MDTRPWSQSAAVNRLRDWTPVHSLSHFASRDWLNDSNLNVMLDVMYEQIRVTDPALEPKHENDYDGSKATSFLRSTGVALAQSPKTIVFICHVRGNHWVSIAINAVEHQIYYGDSNDPVTRSLLGDSAFEYGMLKVEEGSSPFETRQFTRLRGLQMAHRLTQIIGGGQGTVTIWNSHNGEQLRTWLHWEAHSNIRTTCFGIVPRGAFTEPQNATHRDQQASCRVEATFSNLFTGHTFRIPQGPLTETVELIGVAAGKDKPPTPSIDPLSLAFASHEPSSSSAAVTSASLSASSNGSCPLCALFITHAGDLVTVIVSRAEWANLQDARRRSRATSALVTKVTDSLSRPEHGNDSTSVVSSARLPSLCTAISAHCRILVAVTIVLIDVLASLPLASPSSIV